MSGMLEAAVRLGVWRRISAIKGLIYLSGTLLLAACGGGGSGGSDGPNPTPAPLPAEEEPAPELADLTPQQFNFELQQGAQSDQSFSFRNAGGATLTYSISESIDGVSVDPTSGSVAPGGTQNIIVAASCQDEDYSGNLTLSTNDAQQSTTNLPVVVTCTPVAANLVIEKVTFNQGARAFDSSVSNTFSVAVLANRELLVRAFVTGIMPVPSASVVIVTPGGPDQTFPMQTPPAIDGTLPGDETLTDSHYAVIPGAAVQANSSLRIEVGTGANQVRFPASGNMDLAVVDPGPMEITFVPVTYQGSTPTIDTTAFLRQALQVLPIGEYDVQVRTPYVFSGAYDLDQLLIEMADLRDLDNSNRLYHGVIIPPGGSTSGTAGIGYVGYPVSVSIDLGGEFFIVAHEMGHNLDLSHAPGCSSPNPDPQFPQNDGSIGSWGYDIFSDSLVSPNGMVRDFMTYCNNLWVSDYHFNKALAHRAQSPIGFAPVPSGIGQAANPASKKGLTISGRLDPRNNLTKFRMVPTGRVAPNRMLGKSIEKDYEFLAWDANGVQVIRARFGAMGIPDLDERRGFVFNVPQPLNPVDHYEIRHNNLVVAQGRLDTTITRKGVAVDWRSTGTRINWQPAVGEVLVVRNGDGEVVTLNVTGDVELGPEHAAVQLSMQKRGRIGQPVESRRRAKHGGAAAAAALELLF